MIFDNSENNDNEQLIISSDTKNKNFKSNFFEMNLNEFNNNLLNQNNEVKLSILYWNISNRFKFKYSKSYKQTKKDKFIIIHQKRARTTKVKKANQMIGKNFSRKFCHKNIKTKIKNHYITFLLTSLMK